MGSYHIIGGDGKSYGPYSADQLRELLQDNRLKSDSKIQPENGEWTTVQALPEFSTTNPLPPALPPVAADQTAGYNPQPYAAAPELPMSLVEQLTIGGRMVIPIGATADDQELVCINRTEDGFERESMFAVRFVPLVSDQRIGGLAG